jgi:hypothetical protein
MRAITTLGVAGTRVTRTAVSVDVTVPLLIPM